MKKINKGDVIGALLAVGWSGSSALIGYSIGLFIRNKNDEAIMERTQAYIDANKNKKVVD